jgi:hypothetical protein
MMRSGAIAILTVIFTGLMSWAGLQVVEHSEDISSLKTGDKYQILMLREIRDDIKEIKRTIK